jgi:hypothetical protein
MIVQILAHLGSACATKQVVAEFEIGSDLRRNPARISAIHRKLLITVDLR